MRARIAFAQVALVIGLFCSNLSFAQIIYPPLHNGGKNPLIKVATETEELFVRRGVLFKDPELQEIVDRVGESIFPAIQDEFIEFRIYLLRDPSPIMFSLAGGQIYIHTGLLARLGNEAQLAAVLAHEVHHIAAHHHIQANSSRRKKANIAGGIAIALNRRASGDSFPNEWQGGTSYASNIGNDPQSRFSEAQEIEADAASIGLIGRVGHPPRAALQALASIRSDPELSTPSPLASFTSIDSLTERHGRLQELVDGLPARSANATETFDISALVLQRVIEMTIEDYIRLDRPGTAVELIDAMIAVQPDAFMYPEAFLYAAKGDSHVALGPRPNHEPPEKSLWFVNGKRAELTRTEVFNKYMETEDGPARMAHNHESAISAYEEALQLDVNYARAYRGLGNLYLEQKDYRKSGRSYIKYLKLSPDALDRPIVLQNLQHIKSELSIQKEAQE